MPSKERPPKKQTPPRQRKEPREPAPLRPTEDEIHFEHVLRRLVIIRDKLGQR